MIHSFCTFENGQIIYFLHVQIFLKPEILQKKSGDMPWLVQQVLRSLYCCHHFQSCCRRLSCSQKAQETSQSAGFPVKELFFHCSTPFISFKKASVFVYIYPKKRDTRIKNADIAWLFFVTFLFFLSSICSAHSPLSSCLNWICLRCISTGRHF